MGKYMRKCSGAIGEVAVMEVTQVAGVRTRARTLALAAAAAAAGGEASGSGRKRRKVDSDDQFCISYLQLRSRSLVLTRGRTRRTAADTASDCPATSGSSTSPAGNSGELGQCASGDGEWDRVSRCSSNAAEKAGLRSGGSPKTEGDDGSETTACNYDGDLGRWSERTPSSELPELESDNLESTARPAEAGRAQRRGSWAAAAGPQGVGPVMPSEAEIEEFFAAAERQEWKRFTEKYNYDVVKDVPLEGRYEWVQIKP